MTYRAAAIQFNPVLGHPEENVPRLLGLMAGAAAAGARLIVAPEMATSGYCFDDREHVAPCVEPVPGPLTDQLAQITARHGCVIVCGLPEVDPATDLYYNTVALVGPQGYLGKYRKVHFFASDAKWGVEGDLGFPVWDTPCGRLGIAACMDATYPEAGRTLAVQGAQVICFPTNWVGDVCPDERWLSQAFENGVYWIAADRSDAERGLQFMAGSCILDPDGTVQAVAREGEEIVYGEIDLTRTQQRHYDDKGDEDKLAGRRPDLYHPLLHNTYGWVPRYFHTLYGAPDLPAPRTSRVAALQFRPQSGDAAANLATIRRLLGGEDTDLVVLPELALSGTPAPGGQPPALGMPDVVAALIDLARERDTLVATSVVDEAGPHRYHAVVLAGSQGLLACQRKRQLTRDDRWWATPGDEPFHPVDTPVGRLGLLAGYEALFFESLRLLAGQGVDFFCLPAALRWPAPHPLPEGHGTWHFWRTKAWESCAALALANYPGPDFAGGSGIWVPEVRWARGREEVAPPEGEAIVRGTLDTSSRYLREKRGLGWRRLQYYTPIVRKTPVPHP